jgi:hypothetical protein
MKKLKLHVFSALILGFGLLAIAPSSAEAGDGFNGPFGGGFFIPGQPEIIDFPLPDLVIVDIMMLNEREAKVLVKNQGVFRSRSCWVDAENNTGIGWGFCPPINPGGFYKVRVTMRNGARIKGCHLYTDYIVDSLDQVVESSEWNNRALFGDHSC